MNKSTLHQLGGLCRSIDDVFTEWVNSHYQSQEAQLKLVLLIKVKKQLEEQKRGLLKSKINYSGMATYLIKHYKKQYSVLHKEIIKITLKKLTK